jgi:serine/threonine protein kinase
MPRSSLEDLTTDTGWLIKRRIDSPLGSGGNFCARYEAESADGKVGFLKAMDLGSALTDLSRLHSLTKEYLFEQQILDECKIKKMTRVVAPLDMGTIVNPHFPPPANVVYYIIFDMAQGDLRNRHLEIAEKDRRWISAFMALHHTAVGVNQLHKAEIAHQDIKPSNVLSFSDESFKVSDLGRVVDKKGNSPFSALPFPGDGGYKPIELFYGVSSSKFTDRFSCDMYMVGSLVYHLIEDVQITAAVLNDSKLLHPNVRRMDYDLALPFILSAFNTKVTQFKSNCIEKFGLKIGSDLYTIVKEMCYPDPEQRGNARFKNSVSRLGLDKYISLLSQVVINSKIRGLK